MADARLEEIVRNCRNTTTNSCGGYLEPTATGQPGAYVSTILLSTGAVNLEQFPGFPFEEDLDQGMAQIVSYDRAECNDSYIGQVNMLQASSFSGVNGGDLGLRPGSRFPHRQDVSRRAYREYPHLFLDSFARCDPAALRRRRRAALPSARGRHGRLCGEVSDQHGLGRQHVDLVRARFCDCRRPRQPCVPLHGGYGHHALSGETRTPSVRTRLDDRLNRIAYAAYLCGENQGARYKKIYIGWKASHIPKNHVGCALACAPYVTLPVRRVHEH